MKSVKKIRWGLLALCAAFSLILTGCPKSTGGNNSKSDESDPNIGNTTDSVKADYTVASGTEVTVNVGQTVTVKAEGKKAVEFNKIDGLTITYKDNGIFEISASEAMTDAAVNVNFNDGTDEDDGIDVTVYVYDPYYTLNIILTEEIAQKAASIELYVEGKEDGESTAALNQTVEATYTAGEKTAKAKLLKEKANSYKYFNNIRVKVKDSSGTELDVESTPSYFCYSDESFTGMEISAAKQQKIFTLSFEGFTIPGGSVTGLKYSTKWASSSSDWEEDTTFTPEVTVASDGASATFEVENTNEFYIDWTIVVVKDSGDAEIEISSGNTDANKWYSYSGTEWSNTLTHVSGTYQNLVDNKGFSASSAYVQVLEASEFENISISTLKVVVKISSASERWASASSADSWAEETYQTLVWSDDESGYAGVITAESFIEALKTNGLYLNVKEDAVGAVTVDYIAK